MGDSEMSTDLGGSAAQGSAPVDTKGKGKAVDPAPQDMSMDEDDEDSGEEEDEEAGADEEEEDEDNMEEISTDNILPTGRRTRGKEVDFTKAAAEQPAEEDDEEDDDDFEAPAEDEEMQG